MISVGHNYACDEQPVVRKINCCSSLYDECFGEKSISIDVMKESNVFSHIVGSRDCVSYSFIQCCSFEFPNKISYLRTTVY